LNKQLIPPLLALFAGTVALVGCPNGTPGTNPSAPPSGTATASATPAPTPTPISTAPKDYLFPTSANYQAVYDGIQTVATDSVQVATGSMLVTVSSFGATQSITNTVFTGWPAGQPSLGLITPGTTSIAILPNGTLTTNQGTDSTTLETYTSAIFTAAGSVVRPASPQQGPAIRVALIGTESVTVPAGTYNAVKFNLSFDGMSGPPLYYWMVKGIGPVRELLQLPISSGSSVIGTASMEIRLRSSSL
jgi:hypothetical protein